MNDPIASWVPSYTLTADVLRRVCAGRKSISLSEAVNLAAFGASASPDLELMRDPERMRELFSLEPRFEEWLKEQPDKLVTRESAEGLLTARKIETGRAICDAAASERVAMTGRNPISTSIEPIPPIDFKSPKTLGYLDNTIDYDWDRIEDGPQWDSAFKQLQSPKPREWPPWRDVSVECAGFLAWLLKLIAPAKNWSSGASETSCRQWLEAEMRESPEKRPYTRNEFLKQAQSRFPQLSERSFDRAWRQAAIDAGAQAWTKGGRPKSN